MVGKIKRTDVAAVGIGIVGAALLATGIVALALKYLAPTKTPALLLKTAFIATTLSTGAPLTLATIITPIASRIFKKTPSQPKEPDRTKSQYTEQKVPGHVQEVAKALLSTVPKNEEEIWVIDQDIIDSQEGKKCNLNTFFRDGAVIKLNEENNNTQQNELSIERVDSETHNNTEINTYKNFLAARNTLQTFGVPEEQLDLLALQVMILSCQGNDADLLGTHPQSEILQKAYKVSEGRSLILQHTKNRTVNFCVRYIPDKRESVDSDLLQDASLSHQDYSELGDTYPVFGKVYRLYSPESP